ncbi:uncharacterized protein LOC124803242 [Schistocerca piceifrons]|uniref:uncharacterized protein LOC124803242 n=1 Tax=Schistocerca piceifrons TaxID=274613 RepID=UPI001F5E58C3|nr:uncharacterized protein LOC124803242 [Schistocerca piceifrons]
MQSHRVFRAGDTTCAVLSLSSVCLSLYLPLPPLFVCPLPRAKSPRPLPDCYVPAQRLLSGIASPSARAAMMEESASAVPAASPAEMDTYVQQLRAEKTRLDSNPDLSLTQRLVATEKQIQYLLHELNCEMTLNSSVYGVRERESPER